MPRAKAPYKINQLFLNIPEPIDTAMRDMLFDEKAGKVPGGAISSYIVSLIKKDLSRFENLNLGDLLNE